MNNIAYPAHQIDYTPILTIGCLGLGVIACVLLYFYISKADEWRELKAAYDKIMLAFHELDEQAKLIVKIDLELNKAQEELDRRLTGLNTLQKLTRKIAMTLDENEIFRRIDHELASELGFSRSYVATFSETGTVTSRAVVGLDPNKAETALKHLSHDETFMTALKNGTLFSSLNSSQKTKTTITQLFDTEHFILSPLLTQRGLTGFILFGNRYQAPPVTEGDEELVAILSSQLGQSLENTQLFDQVYRSSQMLETKVHERTKELSQTLKTLEEISKKKTEFISAVSHELRTPLTSIKGYASILMTGKVGEIPDAVKERLAKINGHSDNLVKLINDLLDISRIESGRVEMTTLSQPLKPMIDNVADLLTPQLSAKNVALKQIIPTDTPPVEFDKSQFERVFINLISNAIKFTPSGGTITVSLHTNWDRQEILFDVADTGIGINKENLSKIFDEFFRVDNEINMTVKGTGLGLALAKNIVEAHYGRMWVSSEVNVGTTFHFTIPLTHKQKETKRSKTPVLTP
jgi:signal transduction histidine kinase